MVEGLPPLAAAATFSLPMMVAGALGVLGWVMAAPGRMLGIVGLLVALGAVAGAVIYVVNGVAVAAAFGADPVGGTLWFAWVGVQLACIGIGLAYLRLWTRERKAT